MDYNFNSRERVLGRVVLALTLDKKRMVERIVIGRADQARRRLDGAANCDVYYDQTRPLGSLLLSLERDTKGAWSRRGNKLAASYGKVFPFEAERWQMAAPVGDFLQSKYGGGEPSAMFAAVRTWEEYLNCFNMNHGADVLKERLSTLYKPFLVYDSNNLRRMDAASVLSDALRDGESGVELWYPLAKRPFETVVTASSLLPIIYYYLHKVGEWRLVFQKCKVCEKDFLTRSRHYELCSDKCRKVQAVTAKREYDKRVKDDEPEKQYETAYYYWYNRQRRLRKGKAANPERAAAFDVAFKVFCKEAVRRKGLVKRKEMEPDDFKNWLFKQQAEADRLMEELNPKLD